MQHAATARNDGGGMVSYIRYTAFTDVSLSVCNHLKTPAIHPAPLVGPSPRACILVDNPNY